MNKLFLLSILQSVKEKIDCSVALVLPQGVVKWCFYRVLANATSGKYSNQVVPECLTVLQT